jgi:hypothetical protein
MKFSGSLLPVRSWQMNSCQITGVRIDSLDNANDAHWVDSTFLRFSIYTTSYP